MKGIVKRLDFGANQGAGSVTEDFLRGPEHTGVVFEEELGGECARGLRTR
jgi:hypothetical protein